ncbi:MAG TPA: carboxypeptidase-like regulatory domain-containing protein [Candidatus Acidoferrales bacterium]|nr:carboxypeptidase-like regulatory domain-containing protein [Candidatus Acidoferrales bacterium]
MRTAIVVSLVVFLSLPIFAAGAFGQGTGTTLNGSVTATSGAAVENARVSVTNLATSLSTETQTSSTGTYEIANLAAGDYEISVSADGFDSVTQKFTVNSGPTQSLNLTLTPSLPLSDLGFSQSQIQSNPKEQARLDKRSCMLKVHQKLGLTTTVPLAATVISGFFAGGKGVTSS